LHGAWVSYDAQGAITAQGNYTQGKRVGTWYFYNTGEINQVQYQDGRVTQVDRLAKTDTRVVSQFE
jgi:antitoxin component YwqK of YwqJK toxin-antitoxin module